MNFSVRFKEKTCFQQSSVRLSGRLKKQSRRRETVWVMITLEKTLFLFLCLDCIDAMISALFTCTPTEYVLRD